MAWTTSVGKPSRSFHDVCPYWLTSRDGSKAKAHAQYASGIASQTTALVRAFAIPVNLSVHAHFIDVLW